MSDERVTFELSKEYLELVEQAIAQENASFIRETMEGVNPADISQLLDEVDGESAKYVLDVLNNDIGAEVIEELEEDTRKDFLEEFEPHEIAEYLVEMESDDAVDIINDLPVKTREQVIASINDPETAAHVQELMRYDEDCAGGLMAKEMIVANINWTVKETIEEIRRQVENVERIYSVYVVDDSYKLKGRVSIKKIILSGDRVKIQSIYDEDIIHVETYMDEEEVADIMQKYDLDAVPVLNLQGKLVGRITIDDIIDVITEQAEEDRQLMSGISSDVEEDDTVWAISKARLPWLIIGMVGSTLGALTMGAFEQELDKYVTLVFFIPMLMATGGNVGIQSSTLIIQSLANRSNFEESLTKRLIKMLFTAILTGLVLATIAFFIVVIWKGADQTQFGFVVGTAIIGVTLLASIMGTITPLILDKLDVNPAIASGPFITTTNDILGIVVYLAIANLLLP